MTTIVHNYYTFMTDETITAQIPMILQFIQQK